MERAATTDETAQIKALLGEAIDAGADYLVIGRPITAHSNPREAVERILEEIGS